MFKFDRTDFQRIGVAAFGALVLTATSVGAAVGPARAVETAPLAYSQAHVLDGAHG